MSNNEHTKKKLLGNIHQNKPHGSLCMRMIQIRVHTQQKQISHTPHITCYCIHFRGSQGIYSLQQ